MLIERISGRRTAFAKATTKAATKFAEQVAKGSIQLPASIDEVIPFSQGLTAVKKTTASLEELLKAVQRSREIQSFLTMEMQWAQYSKQLVGSTNCSLQNNEGRDFARPLIHC